MRYLNLVAGHNERRPSSPMLLSMMWQSSGEYIIITTQAFSVLSRMYMQLVTLGPTWPASCEPPQFC